MKSTPSLVHGNKFKKQKNKNIHNKKEGFFGMNLGMNLNENSLTKKSIGIINKYNNSPVDDEFQQNYQDTLDEYGDDAEAVIGDTNTYLKRVNPNNPYLGKTVSFSTGEIAYVTQQGVLKLITPSANFRGLKDLNISQTPIPLKIKWNLSYNTPRVAIPTTPSLLTGTPITQPQMLGYEGSNVYVNNLINNPSSTYSGCITNDNSMTFIGGTPPPSSAPVIENNNFTTTNVAINSKLQQTGIATVTKNTVGSWSFYNASLISTNFTNSNPNLFPATFPYGNIAAMLYNTSAKSYVSQNISQQFSPGTYTVSFWACSGDSNNSNICISLTNISNSSNTLQQCTNVGGSWTNIDVSFTISTAGYYTIQISQTTTNVYVAIQNVQLLSGTIDDQPSYSYKQCQQAATQGGYKYFALQNVDPNASLGYCAVSNNAPNVSNQSKIETKVLLWSSKTGQQNNSYAGFMASLTNEGSLSIIDTNGTSIYSTPNKSTAPSNFLGCYGDGPNRAMTLYNNGSQQYNLQSCQSIAASQNAQYYGLQNSTSGQNAQCAFSNNLSQALTYGKATNCTQISDGSWSGGGWSNSVYSIAPQSSYFLTLKNDGNLYIYRGTGPNDIQELIWQTQLTSNPQDTNPTYTATNGKYGQNWMANNSTLAAGEFIGSNNGKYALIMEPNGNLNLYTFTQQINCQKMNDGNMGGGNGAYALYSGQTTYPKNLNQIAYVDPDSTLYSYNITDNEDNGSLNFNYKNTYSKFNGYTDEQGNYDIDEDITTNATINQCKTICNNNSDCAGFVFDVSNNICNPKMYGMYPNDKLNYDTTQLTYVRDKMPANPVPGAPYTTYNIDSVTYNNYKSSNAPVDNSYGLSNLNNADVQQLNKAQNQMNKLSKHMTKSTNFYETGTNAAQNQVITNTSGISNSLTNLKNTNNQIQHFNDFTNIDHILNDSDVLVLQKNYEYLFWTILATSAVLVSINLVKK